MMRRLLATLVLTATVFGSALARDLPADSADTPRAASAAGRPPASRLDLRVGDGIVRIRIRACDACRTSVTVELRLPGFLSTPEFHLVNRTAPAAY